MPRYVFFCQECGERFEKDLPFNSNLANVSCPKGHREVRRVYTAPPILFKGKGFYVTDHRKEPAASKS
jgi:putative FmdB family regulatory protein